jgi:hypothetical protein
MLSGLVALFCLRWGRRRLAHVVMEHTSRAIEDRGSGSTPLLLFALLWLISESGHDRTVTSP